MSLTADPFIESVRAERDVEHPTVEVPALDTHIVEDGDVMAAEHVREEFADCWCQDGRHRHEDRTDWVRGSSTYRPAGSHPIKAYVYAVVTEVEPS